MKIKELKELLANADDNDNLSIIDGQLTLIKDKPQDITDYIKTFENAVDWCVDNGMEYLVKEWNENTIMEGEDIEAYLKLRIITAALNEGWEPSEDDSRYCGDYDRRDGEIGCTYRDNYYNSACAIKLCFKSQKLAEYAATQFSKIYADFCGYKKR